MHGSVILTLVLGVAIAGCATGPHSSSPHSQPQSRPQQQPQPRINLTGYSAAFKQGYADGCESARSLLSHQDGRRFQSDADYAMGWKDGYSICERRGR